MVSRQRHQWGAKRDALGFTLIEVIVVLALMIGIVMAVSPLTIAWVSMSQVNDSVNVVQQGFSKTKASALRNGRAVTNSTPAAYLCVASNVIYVHEAPPSACGTGATWKANVPGNALIENSSATFVCIALSNNGLPVSGTINGTTCSTSRTFTVSKGGQSVVKNVI